MMSAITNKSLFVKRVIKNALKFRRNEIEVVSDNCFLIPLNYRSDLMNGDRFRFANGSQVTVIDQHLLIVIPKS